MSCSTLAMFSREGRQSSTTRPLRVRRFRIYGGRVRRRRRTRALFLSFVRPFGGRRGRPLPPAHRAPRRLLSVPLSRLRGIEGERGPGGSACAWNITGDVEENLERVDVKS